MQIVETRPPAIAGRGRRLPVVSRANELEDANDALLLPSLTDGQVGGIRFAAAALQAAGLVSGRTESSP